MEQLPKEVVWLVSFVLIEAAIIDGRSLRELARPWPTGGTGS